MALFTQDTKIKSLRQTPLFEGLSKKELTQLARQSEDMELEAGTVLCKEGDVGKEFFVIVDGEVDVKRKGRRLGTRGAGDFIGEIALLEDIERTATVTANTPLRVFVLTRPAFQHLINESPAVERKVMRTLARRLAAISKDPALS
jgi:CRP/FNR family transcriptional regulator, cyclic AMP receptor protein